MQTQSYIVLINQYLERLLVFETVFSEYNQTTRNIVKGNCYASESLERIKDYFAKNAIRFDRFVSQINQVQAPDGYLTFNQRLLAALEQFNTGVLTTFNAISCDKIDQEQFETGISYQESAKAEISAAFDYIGQPII